MLIVSLGSTAGAAHGRRGSCATRWSARARASQLARAQPPAPTRTLMLTDLAWARAARAAAAAALAGARRSPPTARSSTRAPPPRCCGRARARSASTRPSAGNRPGRHGLWQRPLERRRLGEAPLLLPWSEGALRRGAGGGARADDRALVLPVPVEPSGTARLGRTTVRDIAAITYAANPAKKGLDRVLAAWRGVRDELAGTAAAGASSWWRERRRRQLELAGFDLEPEPGRARRRRARRRRSTARSCVARACSCARRAARTTASPSWRRSPTAACSSRRPRPGPTRLCRSRVRSTRALVSEDLQGALRTALSDPLGRLRAARAGGARAVSTREAVDRLVADELLPRLLARAPLKRRRHRCLNRPV